MTEFKTTYKQQLQQAKENNINVVSLLVAYEVSNIWGIDYKDFEKICDVVKLIYTKSELDSVYDICERLRYLLEYYYLEELKEMDLNELIRLF